MGTVRVALDRDTPQKDIQVTGENGAPLPFTMRDRTVQFFSGTPGSVRVVAGNREYMYAMTIPELWDSKWVPPADARQGIPHFAAVLDSSIDVWPWLALAGGVCLLAEWVLYGSFRRALRPLVLRHRSRSTAEVRR